MGTLNKEISCCFAGSCACDNYTITHGQPPPEGTGVKTWTGQVQEINSLLLRRLHQLWTPTLCQDRLGTNTQGKVRKGAFIVQECGAGRCIHTPLGEFNYMGYSVRDGRYRFTACGSSHHMTVLFFEFPLVLYLVTIRLARLPLVLYSIYYNGYSILCIVVRTRLLYLR